MKVLLVKPYNLRRPYPALLGLGYLATAIRREHEVVILDCIKENVNIDKRDPVLRQHHPDVLGLQCYTLISNSLRKVLKLAKQIRKDMITVVGGPHPSAMPEDLFTAGRRRPGFLICRRSGNWICRNCWKAWITAVMISAPYRDCAGRRMAGSGPIRRYFSEDLDALGMPAWGSHPSGKPILNLQHGAFYQKFPIAPIMVTRGCPIPVLLLRRSCRLGAEDPQKKHRSCPWRDPISLQQIRNQGFMLSMTTSPGRALRESPVKEIEGHEPGHELGRAERHSHGHPR